MLKQIRSWMASNVSDCIDSNGDVNMTLLAESCAHSIGSDSWLDDESHIVWEVATEFFSG